MNLTNKEISRLIAGAISGQLTSAEEKVFRQWLSDEKNAEFYKRISSPYYLKQKEAAWQAAPVDHAYKKLMRRVMTDGQKPKKRNPVWRSFAAAAAIALLVLGGTFVYFTNQSQPEPYEIVNTLKAPRNGATLILGNGTEVSLEDPAALQEGKLGKAVYNKEASLLEYSDQGSQAAEEIAYNTLIVPRGGMFKVQLPDGSRVWVNANSQLHYPERFTGDERRVSLKGEAYFEVQKGEREFIVETTSGEITVLGTEFNVSAYPEEGEFSSTLVEGSVRLKSKMKQADEVTLVPGERARFDYTNYKGIEVSGVNTDYYTSWINGKVYFFEQDLASLLNTASRWYDFRVEFNDEALKNITFTGVMYREQGLEKLLDLVAITSGVKYEIIKSTHKEHYEVRITKP